MSNVMVNLSADARPVYTIDALDRIVFANAAWIEFMHLNAQQAAAIVGHSVWDFLTGQIAAAAAGDTQTRRLWEVLYQRVRAVSAPLFVPMRADTPQERRVIDIELRPVGDRSIQHICERVWTEARPAVALLDSAYPRDERRLRCCSWCRRIQVRIGAWEEIEDAQLMLSIEAAETLPQLSPSVCNGCRQSLLKTYPARVA